MTGWTWEYIGDQMTLPRLDAMMKFWKDCPPQAQSLNEIRMMIRSYFGIKDEADPGEMTEEEFNRQASELMAFFGGVNG